MCTFTSIEAVIPEQHVRSAIMTVKFLLSQLVICSEDMDMYEVCQRTGIQCGVLYDLLTLLSCV